MTDKPQPPPPEFTINSQAVAAVLNAECRGELVKGSGVLRFVSQDGKWKFDCPVEFGGFVAPDEPCIFSITLLKNQIVEKPITPMGGKLITPRH